MVPRRAWGKNGELELGIVHKYAMSQYIMAEHLVCAFCLKPAHWRRTCGFTDTAQPREAFFFRVSNSGAGAGRAIPWLFQVEKAVWVRDGIEQHSILQRGAWSCVLRCVRRRLLHHCSQFWRRRTSRYSDQLATKFRTEPPNIPVLQPARLLVDPMT